MRAIKFVMVAAVAVMGACNHHSEPSGNVSMRIITEYMPATVTVERGDTDMLERCREWLDQTPVVNSASELPDDPLGFPEYYQKLDYENNTLLLAYMMHRWKIETYSNMYVRNYTEDYYDWYIGLGSSEYDMELTDKVNFTRFAILVPKIPEAGKTRVLWSLRDLAWDWDE